MAVSTLPPHKSPCVPNSDPAASSGTHRLMALFDRGGDQAGITSEGGGRELCVPASGPCLGA